MVIMYMMRKRQNMIVVIVTVRVVMLMIKILTTMMVVMLLMMMVMMITLFIAAKAPGRALLAPSASKNRGERATLSLNHKVLLLGVQSLRRGNGTSQLADRGAKTLDRKLKA